MDAKRIDDMKLAFLVDGDNASAAYVEEMLAEASKYGSVIIRRVYGNWTTTGQVNSWKQKLQEYALIPYQQFPNISNRHMTKNTTDIALIIDAMDILHDGIVNGFVIVSSDSDYTSLAIRIREHGIFVMGIGKKETHDSFRRACDVFVSTENLGKDDVESRDSEAAGARVKKKPSDAIDLLCKAFEYAVNDDGIALNGDIGAALRRLDPAFDTRTYGESSLLSLIEKLDNIFQVERYDRGAIYVRRNDGTKAPPKTFKNKAPVEESCNTTSLDPKDALPLLLQAYRNVEKNRDGVVDTFHLFKSARRIDPDFESINYGKEKITHLLETLPEYFKLARRGKQMIVQLLTDEDDVSFLEEGAIGAVPEDVLEAAPSLDDFATESKTTSKPAKHAKPAKPAKHTKSAPVKEEEYDEPIDFTQKNYSDIDALKIVMYAFENVVGDDGRVYMPRLSREVGRVAPELDFTAFGKKNIREFVEEFDDVFTLTKEGRAVHVERRKGKRPKRDITEFIK